MDTRVAVEDVAGDQSSLRAAWLRSLELVSRYEGGKPDPEAVPLNLTDARHALRLAGTLSAFLDQFDGDAEFVLTAMQNRAYLANATWSVWVDWSGRSALALRRFC